MDKTHRDEEYPQSEINRLSWDEYFMEIAKAASKRSAVKTTQVGAVIVNRHNQIISTGYNGPLSGFPHFRVDNDESEESHAESNAICFAARGHGGCDGATLYSTVVPCKKCAMAIIQSGIKRVAYIGKLTLNDDANPSGLHLLRKSGIMLMEMEWWT